MHVITVMLKNREQVVYLRYKDFVGARNIAGLIEGALSPKVNLPVTAEVREEGTMTIEFPSPSLLKLTDDFGTQAYVEPTAIAGFVLVDIKMEQEGQGLLQLLGLRAQIDLQDKANQDPKLRLAAARGALQPAGGMGRA